MDKIQELLKKKQEAEGKLAALNSEFKGIKHEDAHSELQDTEIRVLLSYLDDLNQQILQLKKKNNFEGP